jgi:hypothetical protein
VLADVCEAFLDDPEDHDLLVGGPDDAGVNLQVDFERAIRRQHLGVAPRAASNTRRDGELNGVLPLQLEQLLNDIAARLLL